MRGFRFRLQRVLELRRHRLERARRELAAARRQFEERAVELRALEGALVRAREALGSQLCRGVGAGELVARQAGIERVQAQAQRVGHELDAARAEIDAARLLLIEAQRAVRTLERLRERALFAHRAERARREQRELDEVGTQAWGRRGKTQ